MQKQIFKDEMDTLELVERRLEVLVSSVVIKWFSEDDDSYLDYRAVSGLCGSKKW